MKHRLLIVLLMPCNALAGPLSLPTTVGLGVTVRQSPFVGGDSSITPTVVTRDRDGMAISGPVWSFSQSPARQVYVGAGLDEWDYKRGDSPQLSDMHALDRAINLRLGAAWKLPAGVLNADAGKDVAAHKGEQVRVRYTLNPVFTRLPARPYLEGQWLSSKLADYYVGVNADEVKAGRPAYQAGDARVLKAGVSLEKPLTTQWTLIGNVDATHYGTAISDSPVIDTRTVWSGQVGLTYQWR